VDDQNLNHQKRSKDMTTKKSKFGILGILSLSAALSAMSATAHEAAGPTDPQIAAIVVAANQVDIDAGKVGKKSKNKDVQAFAQQMITDHTAVNKQAVALVTKLHVTPEENDTSKSLKNGGKENLAHLKKLKGAEFDQAYVDHEVAYHQQVLDAIDNTLIPNAQNSELKALLEKVRPAIDAHLKHAQHIQASMSKAER
jgi:putative membrane protein